MIGFFRSSFRACVVVEIVLVDPNCVRVQDYSRPEGYAK